jgi:hypothetical protein
MHWGNAHFAALMTSGENHLRKEVAFPDPTRTKLNLGDFDWTVEFWFRPTRRTGPPGVVFELGRGPRGESDDATRLLLDDAGSRFVLQNGTGGARVNLPTDAAALDPTHGRWHHLAFVFSRADAKLRHYVDGTEQPGSGGVRLRALAPAEESYFTVGRDGRWERPLAGRIDELRFSEGVLYSGRFTPPPTLSPASQSAGSAALAAGPPLLFGAGKPVPGPVPLLGRKHLLLDGAIAERMENIAFTAHPPRRVERVVDVSGPFRKHLAVVEDEAGLIRIYYGVQEDHLAVLTSRDGLHWEKPSLAPGREGGSRNVVLQEPTATGVVFIDPNGPAEERWKFVTGYGGRGIFLYSSPDGWSFRRHPIAVLPFRAASQSAVFYDDQRQRYVGYHRTDYPATVEGKTQRESVRTETTDLSRPWPFAPVSQDQTAAAARAKRLLPLNPWYLDNGPLTPGGFGLEYPTAFAPDDTLDPPGADIYLPKAMKYPWAPDAYVAFPHLYFHYEEEAPARRVLGEKSRGRGSGPIEAQLAVSRDGIGWKRFPRPAYIPTGTHAGDAIHQVYLAHGMVRRGGEIWQYFFGEEAYHSSWTGGLKRAVYRVVQRFDGFVSADAPYDRVGLLVTRPLLFEGNRLVLNVDTGAAGYAQVGLLDQSGQAIDGFGVDECVYINGDFIETEVEWLRRGKDLAGFEGRPVRLAIRMRGAGLYSFQFVRR